jgi:homoserine kinase type II
MTSEPDYRPVLEHYPALGQVLRCEFLASAGGFSGALLWRLTTSAGSFCLRRWPSEHPTEERLQFIQAVLWHVQQEGFRQVPLPIETRRLAGYVPHAGHLWEIAPWMPGKADYHANPSPARLAAAMQTLARFHAAAASFPLPDAAQAPSPGIQSRLEQLRGLLGGELDRLNSAVEREIRLWPDVAALWPRQRDLFRGAADRVLAVLIRAAKLRVSLSPCIRDIWHDHVLFEGDQVTALIDFGALRVENVAADFARLVGSLVGDDRAAWRQARAAYETVRRLSESEDLLIEAFDQSGVLMSGMSWMQWVFLKGRKFANREAILARVEANLERMSHLAGESV